MARRKANDLDAKNASSLDLSVVKDGNRNNYPNQSFVVSDTGTDDLDIVGHPVIVGSVICAMCVRGEAAVRINFETYSLSHGGFIILAPGAMFLCEEGDYSEDFVVNYISFSPDYVKGISFGHIMYDIKNIPYIQMNDEEYETILDIYNHLRTRYLNFDHPYREEVIQHSLLAAIYDFSVIYDKYTLVINESEQDSYLTKFIDLLFRNYKQHRKTGFYSDKLNITPKYLSKIIKEETGSSVQDWIFQLILFETKSLLRSTKMNIAEIAEHFNFPDSTSFGKFFKKHVGMTPVEYRGINR
jgi:AraC-like DNA-binding protein